MEQSCQQWQDFLQGSGHYLHVKWPELYVINRREAKMTAVFT
jgi:hypothetical protein